MESAKVRVLLTLLISAALFCAFLVFTPWGRESLAVIQERYFAPRPAIQAPASAPPQAPASLPAAGAAAEVQLHPLFGEGFFLDVPLIEQTPELPNGCEATSLAMVLQYHGYPAEKLELAYEYIPRQDFAAGYRTTIGGDPEEVYPGNPGTAQGYYCFPPVVVEGAGAYLEANGGAHRAYDVSGADESQLLEYLAAGWPVMVWQTTDQQPPALREDLAWQLSGTGEVYVPYGNLHVTVLFGYNQDHFYLANPHGQLVEMDRGLLMQDYQAMGSRAVVVMG